MDILRRRSCFLIAPHDTELGRLLESLRSKGIEPFFISEFLASGERPFSKVRSAFRSVDFVVALIMHGQRLENVLFELGVAVGLGKQTFVFAQHGAKVSDSFGAFQIRYADLSDTQNLASMISQMIEASSADESIEREPSPVAHASRREADSPPNRAELISAIQTFRAELEVLSEPASAQKLESRIIDLFNKAGLTAAKAPEPSRRRSRVPDLALWMDGIQKDIGNPVAIEVKSQLSPNSVNDAVSQLAASLASVGAQAGIVLHANRNLRVPSSVLRTSPLIVILSIDELLALLEQNKLGSALRDYKRSPRFG